MPSEIRLWFLLVLFPTLTVLHKRSIGVTVHNSVVVLASVPQLSWWSLCSDFRETNCIWGRRVYQMCYGWESLKLAKQPQKIFLESYELVIWFALSARVLEVLIAICLERKVLYGHVEGVELTYSSFKSLHRSIAAWMSLTGGVYDFKIENVTMLKMVTFLISSLCFPKHVFMNIWALLNRWMQQRHICEYWAKIIVQH